MNSSHLLTHGTAVCGKQCLQTQAAASQHLMFADQFKQFFTKIFSTADWPPRWHCGTWTDFHGWLYIASDLGIWAAYFAIPLLLCRLVVKRKDIPFSGILILFISFILMCGLTHLMDAIIFWWPAYRLSALLRFLTALISVFTVFGLYKILPLVFTLRTFSELEEEIEKRHAAEAALSKSLDITTQNNQQLKGFTHILSHNIRSHASNLSLIFSLVDKEQLGGENKELFDKLSKVSAGLNATLDDLAKAIKIKDTIIEPEHLSFKEMTGKALMIFSSEIAASHAEIELNIDHDEVVYPRIYLESILTNLISNAIKYRCSERKLKIKLRTYRNADRYIVLDCEDNGLGINLEKHGKKLFGLYKTFHNHHNANGVGLFLVKTQVESQGGIIEVESTPGIGSTFKITFNEKN